MRPGAGYLPTLALGRPRGPSTSARRVRTLRKPPRQVYRIYSEEEFLRAEDWPAEAELDHAAIGDREPRSWGRVVGIAALIAAVASVAGIVTMSEVRSRVGSDRRSVGRRIALGASIADRPVAIASEASSRIDRRAAGRKIRSHGRAPRAPAPIGRVDERHAAVERAPVVAQAYIPSRPHPVATVATVPATTVTTAKAPANGARPEFGFERQR